MCSCTEHDKNAGYVPSFQSQSVRVITVLLTAAHDDGSRYDCRCVGTWMMVLGLGTRT
jgi:hypothetical protein